MRRSLTALLSLSLAIFALPASANEVDSKWFIAPVFGAEKLELENSSEEIGYFGLRCGKGLDKYGRLAAQFDASGKSEYQQTGQNSFDGELSLRRSFLVSYDYSVPFATSFRFLPGLTAGYTMTRLRYTNLQNVSETERKNGFSYGGQLAVQGYFNPMFSMELGVQYLAHNGIDFSTTNFGEVKLNDAQRAYLHFNVHF